MLLSFKENRPPKAEAQRMSNCRSWLLTLVRPCEAPGCRSLGDRMLADCSSLPCLLGNFDNIMFLYICLVFGGVPLNA